jgi:hypothetical protein
MSRAVDGGAILVTMVAICLWVRSYYALDRYGWSVRPEGSPEFVISRAVETSPGRLVLRDYSGFM